MQKRLYKYTKITDIKDMLNKTKNEFGNNIAYKIKISEGKYKTFTHSEVRDMVDGLGTALIDMGLKGKKIAVIGENRYEWQIAYLSVVCGTGMVVPLDKSLPENELISLIERSQVEAIFYSKKYEQTLKNAVCNGIGKLKHLISMDLKIHQEGIYSEIELIEKGKKLVKQGNRKFIDAKINAEEMSIMLFTSGTTSTSKVVALSHKNICSNLMDIAAILDISDKDVMLSFLPLHHVFECTVGFLTALYKGMEVTFCDGIKHIVENMNEYKITYMACVPAIYESIYRNILRKLQKENRLDEIKEKIEKCKNLSMEEKKKEFQEIHEMLGGRVRLLISGAASLNREVEQGYRDFGINLVQGYGLTETSPVIGIGTKQNYKLGSIGKCVPSVEAKIEDENEEGIGELVVKGPNIMLGYYQNEEATNEVLKDGWFYTGDLARIDEEGYIFICGRKKSVIVLKNGKNIFPEEMEGLINRIEGVKESFIFAKANTTDDENDIKIYAKIVYDRKIVEEAYKVHTDTEIYNSLNNQVKQINQTLPLYKRIRGIIITEKPLIKTTTSKIKRQEEIKTIKNGI